MTSQTDEPELLAEIPLSATGRVVGLASERLHRFSKSARKSLVLIEGLGAEGDVHAGPFVRHRYLACRQPKIANLRQVHLIASELFDPLRADGYELRPGDLGENILTAGLDLEALPLGTVLKLGAQATIELTGLRTPCVLIDRFKPGLSSAFPVVRSSNLHCDCASVATSLDSFARQTGSFSIACVTTDMAAAIAAHAAQGACSGMSGNSLSTVLRRSIPAAAYSPVQAEARAAPMATQEEASFTKVHPEAQSWHLLRVKNDHSADRQPEEQRHKHRRNKLLSVIESTDI